MPCGCSIFLAMEHAFLCTAIQGKPVNDRNYAKKVEESFKMITTLEGGASFSHGEIIPFYVFNSVKL